MANTKVTTKVIADDAITSDKLASGLTLGGDTTLSGHVSLADGKVLRLGDNNDLQFFHDGTNSNSHIQNQTGALIATTATFVVNNAANTENMITAAQDGAVTLFHNHQAKLATASGGVTITGTATATTFAGELSGTITSATTGTTQSASDNSTKLATTAYVTTAISNLVDSSPSALNTLNELAAALGDDANFSTTVTNSIATKLPLAGGTMTGALNMGSQNITNAGTIASGAITADGNITADYNDTISLNYSVANGDYHKGMSGTSFASGNTARGLHLFNFDNDSNFGINFWVGTTASKVFAARIDYAGNLGLGNDSPTNYYSTFRNLVIGSTGSNGITVVSGTTGAGTVAFADGTSGDAQYRGYIQYNHNGDSLALGSAGGDRVTIDSSGNATFAGNITLGGADADNAVLSLTANTGNWVFTNVQSNRNLEISDSDGTGTVLTIDTSGKVGIGNAPVRQLTVHSDTTITSGFNDIAEFLDTTIGAGGSVSLNIGKANSTKNLGKMAFKYAGSGSNDNALNFGFYDADNLVTLRANGYLGINGTPQNLLHIQGGSSDSRVQFTNNNSGNAYADGFWVGMDSTQAYLLQRENQPISFFTNATKRMSISEDGDVTISDNALTTGIGHFQNTGITSTTGSNAGWTLTTNSGTYNDRGSLEVAGISNRHVFKWGFSGDLAANTWYAFAKRSELATYGPDSGNNSESGFAMYFRIYTYASTSGWGEYLSNRVTNMCWISNYGSNSTQEHEFIVGPGLGHAPNAGHSVDTPSSNPIRMKIHHRMGSNDNPNSDQTFEIRVSSALTGLNPSVNGRQLLIYGYIV